MNLHKNTPISPLENFAHSPHKTFNTSTNRILSMRKTAGFEMTDVSGLIRNWDYERSNWVPYLRARRAVRKLLRTRPAPTHTVLKRLHPYDSWYVYFVFLPQGNLTASHIYTLEKLRSANTGILTICATPNASDLPRELQDKSDAVIWKGLSGYDFSAYSIALREIAAHSPGATAFFINDSVLGPFSDLDKLMHEARWDMTGLTASSLHENHLQSYAFIIKNIDEKRVAQIGAVFPQHTAFDRAGDVILCQELYFARAASRHMSVGAFWYSPTIKVPDPTLTRPIELLDAGFPFLKKSVLGKHAGFQSNAQQTLRARLASEKHPLDMFD